MSKHCLHLGRTPSGASLTWDFSDSTCANRHLLVTGTSGSGKSFAIRYLMEQATRQCRVLIFDLTGEYQKSASCFPNAKLLDPSVAPLAVNGFLQTGSPSSPQRPFCAANTVASLITGCFGLSQKQHAILYDAAKRYLLQPGSRSSFGDFMSFFLSEAPKKKGIPAQPSINVLQPLVDQQLFAGGQRQDWLLRTPGITIYCLAALPGRSQQAVTQLLLSDLLSCIRETGNVDDPFIVIIDEFQRLGFHTESPASILLTEGRKYGCSLWLASQFLMGRFDPEALFCLEQAAIRLRFSPPASELPSLARQLAAQSSFDSPQWKKALGSLQTGRCIASLPGMPEPILCHIGSAQASS